MMRVSRQDEVDGVGLAGVAAAGVVVVLPLLEELSDDVPDELEPSDVDAVFSPPASDFLSPSGFLLEEDE